MTARRIKTNTSLFSMKHTRPSKPPKFGPQLGGTSLRRTTSVPQRIRQTRLPREDAHPGLAAADRKVVLLSRSLLKRAYCLSSHSLRRTHGPCCSWSPHLLWNGTHQTSQATATSCYRQNLLCYPLRPVSPASYRRSRHQSPPTQYIRAILRLLDVAGVKILWM
jgi:hypothetical protein